MINATENTVQDSAQLDIQDLGGKLWRNNSGVAAAMGGGRPVRYGLNNVSKPQNLKWKSGDLVGITPVVITPAHVGRILGVFTMVECKKPGWVYRESDARAEAQCKAINDVNHMGGYAFFLNSEGILIPHLQGLMK